VIKPLKKGKKKEKEQNIGNLMKLHEKFKLNGVNKSDFDSNKKPTKSFYKKLNSLTLKEKKEEKAQETEAEKEQRLIVEKNRLGQTMISESKIKGGD